MTTILILQVVFRNNKNFKKNFKKTNKIKYNKIKIYNRKANKVKI